LQSFENSEIKDFEVIAVDDASEENERIEDLQNKFKFLKVIRINKEEKNFINPCVPFNLAFNECSGDKIIIQNAECLHYSDILKAATEKLNDSNYLSFACYSIDKQTTDKINEINDFCDIKNIVSFLPIRQDVNGQNGWYNHGFYRPTGLHFCSAITKKNLIELNGFDELYATGICYDDNEFLHRVKLKNLKIDFENEYIAIHQHHPNFNYDRQDKTNLENKNRYLFEFLTKRCLSYKVNKNSIFKNVK
jgi:hypothetical protein